MIIRKFDLAMVLIAAVLTACATTPSEPKIVVKEVSVPVPISCVPKAFPAPPVYPDTAEALRSAPGVGELTQLLAAGRVLRIARLSELEKLRDVCQ